jgi:predicted nucleic acid-binding protein
LILADASPLIALAKIGRLALLRDVYGDIAIGPSVKREVVERGRRVDAPGIRQVEAGLQAQWMREVQPTAQETQLAQQLLQSTRLGEGEAESLALAQSPLLPVVLDDKEARVMAEAMGVQYVGTAGVLLAAFVKGHLTYDELATAVRDLGTVLWLAPDIVAEIQRRAREFER